ncbi:MAG: ATP-binding protein [Nitrospirae bacterium]|nr:ATP-binding protein [Nitrospirota bacterium]
MTKDTTVITVPSHPKYLCVVREVSAKFAKVNGLDEAAVEEIRLAIDEACSNVIKYAYRGDTDKKIIVRFRMKRNGLEVIIEDNGIKADPGVIRGRDMDEVRPGGLGVHLIRRAFDVFEFDERKEKGNRIRLFRELRR